MYETESLEKLLPAIDSLVTDPDRFKQRAAAEALAGVSMTVDYVAIEAEILFSSCEGPNTGPCLLLRSFGPGSWAV